MREFELQNLKAIRSVPLVCVKITSSSGKESSLTVCLRDTVKALKDKALGGEYSKESPLYKLILAKSNRELSDENTLEEENVEENGDYVFPSVLDNDNHFLKHNFIYHRRIDPHQETSKRSCWYRRKSE